MKRVLVPLAPGFEEVEALTVVDYLRRAGAHVVTASVGAPNPITGKHRIRVMADIDLDEALAEWGDDWDLVVIPGGSSVPALIASEPLLTLLTHRLAASAPTAAICAGPLALAAAGLSPQTAITSWPGVRDELTEFTSYSEDPVVVDGPIVTSRGAGTSVPFALTLIALLFGDAKATEVQLATVSPAWPS